METMENKSTVFTTKSISSINLIRIKTVNAQ